MTDVFRDQPYLVTGAASGIGLAVAKLLADRGARLALWDRDADGVETAADDLKAVSFHACDVRMNDVVQRHMTRTVEKLGGLRGVIHSAGILHTGRFEDLSLAQQQAMIEVNLCGTVNVAYASLPHLRTTRGSLVLLGSTGGFHGTPEFAVYGATKAAVLSLAQALRIELAETGVHIGVCNPLFVNSPMLTAENRQAGLVISRSPLSHIYPPEAVATALVRGIERRSFQIWVGVRPRLIYALTRYGSFMAHRLMKSTWQQSLSGR